MIIIFLSSPNVLSEMCEIITRSCEIITRTREIIVIFLVALICFGIFRTRDMLPDKTIKT